MKNKLILAIALLFTIVIASCSSCSRGYQTLENDTEALANATGGEENHDLLEEDSEGSGDAEEYYHDGIRIPTCSLSDYSYCFLDRLYQDVNSIELCDSNSSAITDVTLISGTEFSGTEFKVFTCPSYMPSTSETPFDLIVISKNNKFVSVSEAHQFDTLLDLITAQRTLSAIYASECQVFDSSVISNVFICPVEDRNIAVSVSASSDASGNFLIVNFSSSIEEFIEIIEIIEG